MVNVCNAQIELFIAGLQLENFFYNYQNKHETHIPRRNGNHGNGKMNKIRNP